MDRLVKEAVHDVEVGALLHESLEHFNMGVDARKVERGDVIRRRPLLSDGGCVDLLRQLVKFDHVEVKLVEAIVFVLDERFEQFNDKGLVTALGQITDA